MHSENLALDAKGVNEYVNLVGAKLKQFTKWFVSLYVLTCLQVGEIRKLGSVLFSLHRKMTKSTAVDFSSNITRPCM